MGYVTPEQIAQAKEWDLLTYLQRYDPHQLVHVGGSTYCTREHDSLKISNGKWNWFSRKIGGKTALDYLIKVQGGGSPDGAEPLSPASGGPGRAEGAGTPEAGPPPSQPVRYPCCQLSSWAGHRLRCDRLLHPDRALV